MLPVDTNAFLRPAARRFLPLAMALLLAACATKPEPSSGRLALRLAPAALGESIALQQHLKVERDGRTDDLDTALEVDADHVMLVGLALGQRVLSLDYNGRELTSWRHVMLPSQVKAEDVLEDLQLVLWPADAITQALPPGWRLEEQGLRRTLYRGEAPEAVIDYSAMPRWSGTVTLDNLHYHYRLTIQSVSAGP